jgi:hypothetical protein
VVSYERVKQPNPPFDKLLTPDEQFSLKIQPLFLASQRVTPSIIAVL